MREFDKLWNYKDPAASEALFKEVLDSFDKEDDFDGYLQLLTQIARTHSLRRMFNEAHETLDIVEGKLPEQFCVAQVRFHLEKGRAYNTAGNKAEAARHFEEAKRIAVILYEDFYAVDAIHMLAIAAPPAEAIKLNEEAVLYAENATEERAKGWLGSLYNNLGWAYFDLGQYEKAMSIFLRGLKWWEERKMAPQLFLAKWCVGRTLRALGRLEEAQIVQLALLEEMVKSETPDGYVYEELGEIYLAKNEPVYKMYFQFAYNLLGEDAWFAQSEAERLERMQQLAK